MTQDEGNARKTTIRVAVVEDDPDIRAGLEVLLDGGSGARCIAAFASGEEALAGLREGVDVDLVLMDIELPGDTGIETTRRLRAKRPDLEVVMLTVREDDDAVFQSLCAGAVGYLLKTTPPSRLFAAIEEAHAGGAPMSPTIARRVARSFQSTSPSPLSERETEILAQLCQGMSYREIGNALFISERTVHSHLKNIYRKLEVHSKTEAMARAMRERWV